MNSRISDGEDCCLPPGDGFATFLFDEKGRLKFLFLDFAIYSPTGLQQAQAVGAPINTGAVINGKYSIVKNTGGFNQTPAGARLEKFSKKWDGKLYGGPVEDGVDFKLNLLDEVMPMSTPILP